MKWWKLWPVFLLLLLTPIAVLFNPDHVVTPTLRVQGFKSVMILMVSGTVGTVEMFLWYIGWGGIRGLIAGWFEEDVNFAKKIAGDMKSGGYVDEAKIHFTRRYKKLKEKADKLKKGLRATSYLAFFGIGFWPIWGPRVVGDFICGTARWKWCFVALCIGNFVKTAGYVFAWDKIFSFFGW